MLWPRSILFVLGFVLAAASAVGEPIDRHALVTRHNPELTRIDPHAPLMLGNGELGFTADITGLQTFPEQYAPQSPLLTMAQWAWHSFPNPHGYTEVDGLTQVAVPGRGEQPYAWMRSWSDADARPAFTWLRANPHRFSLGRIALALRGADGHAAQYAEISETHQQLDLWSGTLTSHFVFAHQPVSVVTRVHPSRDMVMVEVRSPLVAAGRLGVDVRYPGVALQINGDPSDWAHDDAHTTHIVRQSAGALVLRRQLDDTVYFSSIVAPGGRIERVGAHAFRVSAWRGDRLVVLVGFDRDAGSVARPVVYARAARDGAAWWRRYWTRGGVLDFSGSTDPRAAELERRVVLSQYLSAINGAGDLPPQEEGLFSNSWYGKFHLEVHPLHAAHFATWGHPEMLERSLAWYLTELPRAEAEARRHGAEGAWWPKMVGPEGHNSPSTINPFIMWQQPHPIYMAELIYRARPTSETLTRYAELVEQTGRMLASWPRWDEAAQRYVLGPPVIPAQENHDPLTTFDPTYEIEYFRWGLETAQTWRVRRGLPRSADWDRVIAKLSPPPQRDGLYLPVESEPDFWRVAMSPACAGHAVAETCGNRDHASFLMACAMFCGDRVDMETLRRSLRATEQYWDTRQLWGWDFPVIAMTAARLGEPEDAVNWLFRDERNNQWRSSGMTPRSHLNADGQSFALDADTYFPSNGSLLLAVGMMAAGWEGSYGVAPGFPKTGWRVRAEGIRPLP
ncbi:MAG: hypothetical protein ABUS48_01660 [Pseudomonadota bacterium]